MIALHVGVVDYTLRGYTGRKAYDTAAGILCNTKRDTGGPENAQDGCARHLVRYAAALITRESTARRLGP
jgi:hypothetical protein